MLSLTGLTAQQGRLEYPKKGKGTSRRTRSNEEWLRGLKRSGAKQQETLEDLQDYLLRAVYFFLSRHRSELTHLDRKEVEQLAEDCVQDALESILTRLGTFRGESKFTTWAYQVVINVAAGTLRRRRWADFSLESLSGGEGCPFLLGALEGSDVQDPEQAAQQGEILEPLQKTIDEDLTERQRIVLTSLVLHEIPPDILAEHLNTNHNNIYKIVHDARKTLKQRLVELDLSGEHILAIFGDKEHHDINQ